MSETTLNVRIQNRTDLEANWSYADPVLMKGEIAVSSDKGNLYKVGDGTSKWSELTYNSAVSADTANYANYSTQALSDNKGQQIDTTYVSGINVEQLEDSSVQITVTKGDASSKVFSFVDKDTTYEVMTGATNTANGASGLVPKPISGDNKKFLRGDGTYAIAGDVYYEKTVTLSTSGKTTVTVIDATTSNLPTNATYAVATSIDDMSYTDLSCTTAGTVTFDLPKWGSAETISIRLYVKYANS